MSGMFSVINTDQIIAVDLLKIEKSFTNSNKMVDTRLYNDNSYNNNNNNKNNNNDNDNNNY